MGKLRVGKYIEDIESRTAQYTVDDVVTMCKRKNNKKRDFLFVNKYLGKHIPQRPKKVLQMFQELLLEIELKVDKRERVLVVGFAETATALGEYIGNNLSNSVYYLQTTREELEGYKPLISFDEEHSHAVSQRMYAVGGVPVEYDRVLFVEDEITTGNTILNFIEKFEDVCPKKVYSVASILNWQDKEAQDTYKKRGIARYYLIGGEIIDTTEKLDIIEKPAKEIENRVEHKPNTTTKLYVDVKDARAGKTADKSMAVSEIVAEHIRGKVKDSTAKIGIIGTEEYMLLPILVGMCLEEQGYNVRTHSTTRSPIVASEEDGYAIRSCEKLSSAYEEVRGTYIYNVEEEGYDEVFVLTDTKVPVSFKKDIERVFRGKTKIIEIGKGQK